MDVELAKVIELQNIMWILIATGSVLFMQAGFCFLEAGSVRSKNSINVAVKNFCDFCLTSGVFWVAGFGIMYSSAGHTFNPDYFLIAITDSPKLLAFFVFQLVFCGTASTIMSGAVAERTTFAGYLVIAFFVSGVLYPLFGRWAWNGNFEGLNLGWLNQLGFVDFAGSSVVHSIGGWASLAAVMVIGPRIGRFCESSPSIQGHNIPMATVGTIILWFGWFGFNGGSSLKFDHTIPIIILNTNLAASFGAISVLLLTWYKHQKPDVPHVLNGALAGLVSITASCNAVLPQQAVLIGLCGGAIYLGSTKVLEHFKIDDVVKAAPVHGVCGAWGTLCVALFGSAEVLGTGLSFTGQLSIQLLGILVCFVWAFVPTYLFLKFIQKFIPLRVKAEDEIRGLNTSEHNAHTEVLDLLHAMEKQKNDSDFGKSVHEEPHTEVGQIAREYNRVLAVAHSEMENSNRVNAELMASFRELQLAQTQLVESEKMASLGGLVAGIAHEINTPLGVSVTATSYLERELRFLESQYKSGELTSEDVEKFIQGANEGAGIILINLTRATELIKSFKMVAVDQSSEKCREFDLREYIDEVLFSLQPKFRTNQHSIEVSCPEGIVIFSHPGALAQILTCFLMNSLHHGFEQGDIGEVHIEARLIGGEVELIYRDDGQGIDSDSLQRIFEPFYTTKRGKGGSGLGLHIVFNLVTQTLGGTITCRSEPGEGTEFTVKFPVTLESPNN
ncbi:ammonium transporter [Shewanella psychrophila]|uniref:Ammonium transporter n=1 Tax=Shewanella psychrophila TaxID=225848 RepID=A0A1S6HWS3_9GAMM|nr:ammonium transporter [Shewanella psychrophila]AQS39993.1 ammonium transporter [Shewanella psychrophila]